LVAGPVTALITTASALLGGFIGFLVDQGLPEADAREYEAAIKRGEVLVTVSAAGEDAKRVRKILEKYGAYSAGAHRPSAHH
jgi:hypothetical protein